MIRNTGPGSPSEIPFDPTGTELEVLNGAGLEKLYFHALYDDKVVRAHTFTLNRRPAPIRFASIQAITTMQNVLGDFAENTEDALDEATRYTPDSTWEEAAINVRRQLGNEALTMIKQLGDMQEQWIQQTLTALEQQPRKPRKRWLGL